MRTVKKITLLAVVLVLGLLYSCTTVVAPPQTGASPTAGGASATPASQFAGDWVNISAEETLKFSQTFVKAGFPKGVGGKAILSVQMNGPYRFGYFTQYNRQIFQKQQTFTRFVAGLGDQDVTFFVDKGTIKVDYAQKPGEKIPDNIQREIDSLPTL